MINFETATKREKKKKTDLMQLKLTDAFKSV